MKRDWSWWIALTWVAAITGLSIALAYNEETKSGEHHHGRVVAIVSASFVLAPLVAGLVHRSKRIAGLVSLLGLAGWFLSLSYFSWAYSNIGGGP
jgi:hypothetical protein